MKSQNIAPFRPSPSAAASLHRAPIHASTASLALAAAILLNCPTLALSNPLLKPANIHSGNELSQSLAFPLIEFRPEYDRGLARVLVGATGPAGSQLMLAGIRILEGLPEYSQITLLTSFEDPGKKGAGSAVAELVERRPSLADRLKLLRGVGPSWIQDFGEGLGNRLVFSSSFYDGAWENELATAGFDVFRHELPVTGGNIQLARSRDGTKILFIGSNEFSGIAWITDILESYRATFGADRVVILPTLETEHIDQTTMFLANGVVAMEDLPPVNRADRHMVIRYLVDRANSDQRGDRRQIPLFPRGYAGDTRSIRLTRIDPGSASAIIWEVMPTEWMSRDEAALFRIQTVRNPAFYDHLYSYQQNRNHQRLAAILEREGFTVLRLKTSVWHHFNCMHYVNGQAFRNLLTGEASVLLPVFPAPRLGMIPEVVDPQNLSGLNAENAEILRSAGFNVVPVQSVFKQGGNLHCMIYNLD
jgi:hypothetical protein